MRTIIEVEVGGYFDLDELGIEGEDIQRVWTIVDELQMWEGTKFDPKTGERLLNPTLDQLVISHREGVFLEDKMHDWKVTSANKFHYYTRVAEEGSLQRVLLEIEEDV